MNAITMADVIVPKSDQINADDFIAGPQTITIRSVEIRGGQEQPVSIYFEGSDKAFRPCKSMSRVMVQAWGPDANVYAGRSMTLYRDPDVKWGGLAVGGIRISHMSHIDGKMQFQLTATKGQRKPHLVLPLVIEAKPDPAQRWADAYTTQVGQIADTDALDQFAAQKAPKLAELKTKRADLFALCTAALELRRDQLAPHVPEGRADEDMGEGFTDGDD